MRLVAQIIGLLGLLLLVTSTSVTPWSKPEGSPISFAKSLDFKPGEVYLFLRGSDSKLSGYAREYNKTHPLASHVALGIYTDSLRIYHVNTTSTREDNLRIDNLAKFSDNSEDRHIYLGVWKLTELSEQTFEEIVKQVSWYSEQEIKFDYKFDFESEDKLYCSEFIYKTLTTANRAQFSLPMTTKEVPNNHRFFLKKDELQFYPTDFFLDYTKLELLGEWSSARKPKSWVTN